MPSSSLFLRSSTTLVSALSLFSAATAYGGPSAATTYSLDTSYSGDSFYTGWDFWTEADPTHGFVTYLDEEDAQDAGLLKRGPSGSNIIGVDSTNTYDYNVSYYGVNGLGRPSVRISTQKTWNHGLFIADIANMPGGVCGTWPAFWTLGDGTWPYHGEIDILEGANDQQNVLTSLHTAGTCSIAGSNETGTLQASNCTYDVATGANSAGCGVSDPDTSSFGLQFNSNRGGVYAMEWTSEAIKVWFWSRSSIPLNILSGRPDPSTWGLPDANMAGSCDFDSNFQNHQIVIDNTFCGDWAGNTWGNSCQASTGVSTCAQYVGENPSAFSNMYWDINSIKVYTSTSASSTTTSSCTTTTPSYTTPTVSTTLSTTTRGPYTTPAISSWGTSTTPVPFQNMTWGTTTQISSSSVSTPLKSVAPQGSLVGVPMGGGVGITRTVSGHGFSQPTNTVSTGHNARAGSSTAADGWKSSSSTSSSTSAYNWKPSSSVPSSTASVSDDGQDWSNWESSETSSTFTSTVTLDPVWPDWSSSSSSVPTSLSSWADWTQSASPSSTSTSSSSSWVEWTQSTSSSSTTSTSSSSSWADWSQSSTVTIAVSTLTVSPVQYSAMPAATTYNNAWGSGSSSTISPIAAAATSGANAWSSAASPAATSGANAWPSAAAASSSSGANAWSSAASPASYNANSTTSAWVAAYTGAASRQDPVAIAGSAIFAAVGIVVASMVL